MTRCTLFTSIAPRNIEAQVKALSSWRCFADKIVTVNESSEAGKLDALPDWISRYTFSDQTIPYKVPYVSLSHLSEAIASEARQSQRALLCNSDISLARPQALLEDLRNHSETLFFCSRTDVDSNGQPLSVYTDGFDFFAFPPNAADTLDHPELFIGLPWWDFYVPLAFATGGFSVRRLDAAHIHHERHAQNWNKKQYYRKASTVLRTLTGIRRKLPLTYREVNVFAGQANRVLNGCLFKHDIEVQAAELPKILDFWKELFSYKNLFRINELRDHVGHQAEDLAQMSSALARFSPALHRQGRSIYHRLQLALRPQLNWEVLDNCSLKSCKERKH